jgi:hypothetical protein
MCDQIVKALLIMLLSSSILSAQHLSSARGIGIAAATATTRDGSAIDWNPATLVDVPDMEVEISSYISTQNSGFSLLSLSATKRILENHTLALAYTPGKELSFAVPAMLTILDSAGMSSVRDMLFVRCELSLSVLRFVCLTVTLRM